MINHINRLNKSYLKINFEGYKLVGCKEKSFYGTVKVGERGQIVIPKKARDDHDIKAGDSLIVFGDDRRITIIKADIMRDFASKILEDLEDDH